MPRVSSNLREKLEHQLGSEATEELLNLMPPDWTQLATKHDLEILGTDLRGQMGGLRSEVQGEIKAVRGEIQALSGEVRGEIAAVRGEISTLRSEVRGEIAAVRGEISTLRSEVQGEFSTLRSEVQGEFSTLRSEVRGEFAAVRHEFAATGSEILITLHRELRRQTAFFAASLLTLAALVLGSQLLN